MAKNTYKTNTVKSKEKGKKERKKFRLNLRFDFLKDRRLQLAFGFFLLISALYLFTAFFSYLFTGRADQSVIEAAAETGLRTSGEETENWLGLFGAWTSYFFIFKWFGLSAFFVPPLLFIVGYWVVTRKKLISPYPAFTFSFFFMFWISIFLGYLLLRTEEVGQWGFLSGGIGFELALLFDGMLGWGTFLLLAFSLFVFVIYYFNVTSLIGFNTRIKDGVQNIEQNLKDSIDEMQQPLPTGAAYPADAEEEERPAAIEEEGVPGEEEDVKSWKVSKTPEPAPPKPAVSSTLDFEVEDTTGRTQQPEVEEEEGLGFEVYENEEADEKVQVQENYDPTLDLGSYKYPPVELLNEYETGKIKVSLYTAE